jgi:signal transduction histidine kinase
MGIQCDFIAAPEEIDLNEEYSTAIYRIVQESLTNVARHANATRVTVTLNEASGNIILEVKDNGIGIRKEQVTDSKSLGLLGMQERALPFGGAVDIYGRPGKGTTVLVRIPLKKN